MNIKDRELNEREEGLFNALVAKFDSQMRPESNILSRDVMQVIWDYDANVKLGKETVAQREAPQFPKKEVVPTQTAAQPGPTKTPNQPIPQFVPGEVKREVK